MDRIGRKPLMLTGVVGCCVCLILEAAMIASFASPIPTNPAAINHAGLRMGVAALYVLHPTSRFPLNPTLHSPASLASSENLRFSKTDSDF